MISLCTTSIHSKFCKIVLWYECTRDNMDGLYVTNLSCASCHPGREGRSWTGLIESSHRSPAGRLFRDTFQSPQKTILQVIIMMADYSVSCRLIQGGSLITHRSLSLFLCLMMVLRIMALKHLQLWFLWSICSNFEFTEASAATLSSMNCRKIYEPSLFC